MDAQSIKYSCISLQIKLLSLSLLFSVLATAQNVDTDSSKVHFSITKLGKHVVEGDFRGMTGTVVFNGKDLTSIDVCIKPETINSGNKRRDAHLKNEDYFDVKNYPSICFQSDSIVSVGDSVTAVGKMTMLDSTRNESIAIWYSQDLVKGYLELDRFLYDLGEEGNYKIGRMVKLEIYCVLKQEE